MKKENWQKVFGVIPDDYGRGLNGMLNSLTETPERRIIRKPVLVLAAALVLLLGIAAAAGNNRMFEIFRKTPLESAEQIVVDISGEPIKVNDDITATVDRVYYDDREIFYEMTLTLTDPESYALLNADLLPSDYVPPTDITYIYLSSRLWHSFEIDELFGEPVASSYDDIALLEAIGNGSYKLYGHSLVELDDGLIFPEEMDLDVSLLLTYSPQKPVSLFFGSDKVDAEIPFHATKTAVTKKYTLTPVTLPEGWTMHSAKLDVSPVDCYASLDFSVEREPVNVNNADYYANRNNFPPNNSYGFMLHDPNDPENLIKLYGGGTYGADGTARRYEQSVIFNAIDPVPEKLTFTLTKPEKVEDEWEHMPFTTIEFIVTEIE